MNDDEINSRWTLNGEESLLSNPPVAILFPSRCRPSGEAYQKLTQWGVDFNLLRKQRLTGIGIPDINLIWSSDRLRFVMVIPIPVRKHLIFLIEAHNKMTESVLTAITHTFSWNELFIYWFKSWWRHQIETFSALLAICAGNSSVTDEFPAQRPVTRSFDVSFDLRLNKRLSKQSLGWQFEMPLRPLWRHCNVPLKFVCSSLINSNNSVDSDDGLVTNKRHVITRTSDGRIHRHMYASRNLREFSDCFVDAFIPSLLISTGQGKSKAIKAWWMQTTYL